MNTNKMVDICRPLIQDKAYTFNCIESTFFGRVNYQVYYRGEKTFSIWLDASGIEKLMGLLNGAYTMGISDAILTIEQAEFNNEYSKS